jgi:peptide-methionine (S)-S-oxide reductase
MAVSGVRKRFSSNWKAFLKFSSGYSGGHVVDPSYKEVCTGTTGHAECIQIIFDPAKISFDELLEVFWQTHDPTTLNRQGNDEGTSIPERCFLSFPGTKGKSGKV